MTTSPVSERIVAVSSQRRTTPIMLLWLCGVGLRVTILAVPPVIPLIHADLRLTETEVGVLTGLPPLLFAVAAVPGSLLIARLGAVSTVVVGLLLTGIAGALRGAATDAALLFAATIATGFGVALMQPAMPTLVRQWLPHRIGFGTALYTNGLLVGEIIPVALTIPMMLPLVGGSWRLDFFVWGLVVVAIALVVRVLAPRGSDRPAAAVRPRWWPDWKSPLLWRLGLMLGGVNAVYFSSNAFLPDYLDSIGRPDLVSGALIGLNLGQMPAALLLLAVAGRLERRLWPYVACGCVALIGLAGVVLAPGAWIIAATSLLGSALAAVLILLLALPPLLSAPEDVHRLSAAMFTISYTMAVAVPVVSGILWDLSGVPAMAFVPMAIAIAVLIVLAPKVDFSAHAA